MTDKFMSLPNNVITIEMVVFKEQIDKMHLKIPTVSHLRQYLAKKTNECLPM